MSNITLSKVQSFYEAIHDYFEQYPQRKGEHHELEQIEKTLKEKRYEVAVVANMSAGKSTFINALLGGHILPTSTKATTDCPTYIYSSSKKKYAEIFFEDNRAPVKLDEENLGELEEYAKKDEDCKDSKHHKVQKIHLYHPLKHLNSQQEQGFEVVFIDTPGPNSTGEEYANKHKNTTQEVIHDANLVLFLFDYGQLDANLTDKQGLWNTLAIRMQSSKKNFDVFFVINKIDGAFKDYNNDLRDCDGEQQEIAKMRELWGNREKEAIKKIAQSAKCISPEPKVYGVSAHYAFLRRSIENISTKEQRAYKRFVEDHFKAYFEEEWGNKLVEYLGVERLESEMNDFLLNIKEQLLSNLYDKLTKVIEHEERAIKDEIKMLQNHDAKEAKKKLNKAEDFIKNEAPKLQKNMEKEALEIEQETQKQLKEKLNVYMNQYFCDHIGMLAALCVMFLHFYAEGNSYEDSKKMAKEELEKDLQSNKDSQATKNEQQTPESQKTDNTDDTPTDTARGMSVGDFMTDFFANMSASATTVGSAIYTILFSSKNYKMNEEKRLAYLEHIKLSKTVKFEDARENMERFLQECLMDCYHGFKNIRTPIQEIYEYMNKRNQSLLNVFKEKLEEAIHQEMEIEYEKIEPTLLDDGWLANFDIKQLTEHFKHTTLEAQYEVVNDATWYNPLTYFNTKKVKKQDKQHFVSPDDELFSNQEYFNQALSNTIKDAMQPILDGIQQDYEKKIAQAKQDILKLFEEFQVIQTKNMQDLQEKFNNTQEDIRKNNEQFKVLENLSKEFPPTSNGWKKALGV